MEYEYPPPLDDDDDPPRPLPRTMTLIIPTPPLGDRFALVSLTVAIGRMVEDVAVEDDTLGGDVTLFVSLLTLENGNRPL